MFNLSNNIQDYISYSCGFTIKIGKIAISFANVSKIIHEVMLFSDFFKIQT